MTKQIQILMCERCDSYCDDEYCYICDDDHVRRKTITYDKTEHMQKVTAEIEKYADDKKNILVMMSEFGDAPAHVNHDQPIIMTIDKVHHILENHDFLLNDISQYENINCVGIALLKPYTYDSVDVFGLFISHV